MNEKNIKIKKNGQQFHVSNEFEKRRSDGGEERRIETNQAERSVRFMCLFMLLECCWLLFSSSSVAASSAISLSLVLSFSIFRSVARSANIKDASAKY